jgi:molecular chaperone DnaJ
MRKMAEKKDYYELLGVTKSATQEEIKKAFRKAALKHHPDKGGGKEAEAKFKEVNEAYQILSDPEKRKMYDQFGHNGPKMGGGQGGFDWGQYAGGGYGQNGFNVNFEDLGGLGDIFGEMFGGGRSRAPKRGSDVEAHITIDFAEMVKGVEREVTLSGMVGCDRCSGKGTEPGTSLKTCSTCKGSGRVTHQVQTIFGTIAQSGTCETCGGSGKVPEKPCTKCRGKGRIESTRDIKVKIPAGIDDGQTIRVSGKGEAGPAGTPAGDLYLVVRVRPNHEFKREGSNIYSTSSISFPMAALGTTIDVKTVEDVVKLKIPAGTQSGKVFRLSGRGLSFPGSHRKGDHFVTVEVVTPSKLSSRQKKLLEEFEADKSWF